MARRAVRKTAEPQPRGYNFQAWESSHHQSPKVAAEETTEVAEVGKRFAEEGN